MPAIKQVLLHRTLPTMLALVTATVAIAWLLLSANADYDREISLGERQTELLATGLQDTTERYFNEVNGEIVAIQLALERRLASGQSIAGLRDETLRLLDDDGDIVRIVVSVDGSELLDILPAGAAATGFDLRAIEWSNLATAFPFGFVNIAKPLVPPDNSAVAVPLRYNFVGGRDRVEIVALVDPTQILHGYEAVELAPGSAFAVFRADGVLLARWPEMLQYLGRKFSGAIFGQHLNIAPAATIRARVETDEHERILSYRTVRDWPIVVVAGVPVRDVLTSWFANLPGKAVLLLFILSAIFLLWAALRRSQSDLRRSIEAITVSEGRYARLIANIPGGVYTRRLMPPDRLEYVFTSQGFRNNFGAPAGDLSLDTSSLLGMVHPDDRQDLRDSIIASSHGDEVWTKEFRALKPNGQLMWVRSVARRYRGEDGSTLWDGIAIDITDLRQREALLERVQKTANLGYWVWQPGPGNDSLDQAARRTDYSPACAEILGLRQDELQLTDAEFVLRIVHPDDRERFQREYQRFLDTEDATYDVEYRAIRPDGAERWVHGTATKDIVEGKVVRILGVMQDVTDAKTHESELAQAQKMEAIGGLTGGVAHDFNNLLTVVIGNLEALMGRVRLDPLSTELAEAALGAADRGATLTKRLLAFARRQPLSPRAIDMHQLLVDLLPLLNRSVGALIKVNIKAAPDLPKAMADPHQLENAIINLANNARDAMPRGGDLTIRVDRSDPQRDDGVDAKAAADGGPFLCVAVSDTGVGMSRETLKRAIEPFFTTKPVGQGTGLGLSMVYGLARQSKGHLRIDSEPGIGTTIRLYLPTAAAEVAGPVDADGAIADFAGAKALLVDDDPAVRRTTAAMLGSIGFTVREAATGKEALQVLEGTAPIDILVTDVILAGGMLGPEVAERARALRPGLKILFISGYASDSVAEIQPLLSKPFRRAELAQQIALLLRD